MLLATCGLVTGVDCSQRGDQTGFLQVLDERTLLIRDRQGNNRIDSLRNIVEQPAVGLLFLAPAINERFLINGQAKISVDPTLIGRFVVSGQRPKWVVIVTVQEAFIQCSRAILRADLWNRANRSTREQLPSPGTMLAAHTRCLSTPTSMTPMCATRCQRRSDEPFRDSQKRFEIFGGLLMTAGAGQFLPS